MTDSFGRRIDYLRLSVTDRCNLRCVYCLPEAHVRFTPAAEALTDDELVALIGCFVGLGVSKLRVTGGEPLLRPGLVELVGRLAALPGLADLSLSTNGVRLAELAAPLARAGLRRVNVSLDSLDPDRFARIARHGRLADVLEGLEAARAAGLSPIKLNVVVARGMNDGELGRFAELTVEAPLHVRFIELMPMGETGFYAPERRVDLTAIMEAAGPLEPVPSSERPVGSGPARCYRRPGAKGTIGLIGALSCGFCSSCNRVRVTARGRLVPCLDGEEGADLRGALAEGGPEAVREAIRRTVAAKPEAHSMAVRAGASASAPNPRLMCQVGG
ncbi:MAG: GTP 3',8-cyclase MoaA [Elusimicrobia bacterium]|nr:GTP 3',8-cyclase MoaA [Elusimicrobiota bacterium]